jgi:hypothetical protein
MGEQKRKLEIKYFVFKMKQKIDIDYLASQILGLIPYGENGHKIVTVEELTQIFLDSMRD